MKDMIDLIKYFLIGIAMLVLLVLISSLFAEFIIIHPVISIVIALIGLILVVGKIIYVNL